MHIEDMEWVAIRSVYQFGVNSKGLNIFEERVVVFQAENIDEAHKKAKKESLKYAAENEFIVHSERVGYRQDGEPLIDGYEVWSELFEANMTLNEFYKQRYQQYEYHPDNA